MQKPLFEIFTTVHLADVRKFLYFATFRRNKWMVPSMIALSFAVSFGMELISSSFSIVWVLLYGTFLSLAILAMQCYLVNSKNKAQKEKYREPVLTVFSFYEDHVVLDKRQQQTKAEHTYESIHAVYETKDYLAVYLTERIVALLCKRDVQDIAPCTTFLRKKLGNRYH